MAWTRILGVAVGATLAAALVTAALQAVLGKPEALLFAGAVAVSAWYAGRAAGLLASALSILALDYFFIAPIGSFEPDLHKAIYLAAFTFVAFIISSTNEALRHARALAEERAEQIRELHDEERKARLNAEKLARTREEVLGIVAHDLRNPLNLVGTTAELLLKPGLPQPNHDELLGVMRRSVQQMNRLIQDLLEAARIAAGRLSMNLADVDVSDLLLQAEATFRRAAEERHVQLDVAPVSAMRARADADRVQQVLGNLVGNALKFTPATGRITVSARPDGGTVLFEVHDTGPGIDAKDLDHLFDQYWQARTNDSRGIGLGLAIAKSIVEAHGGRIWVESNPGAGSTFRFTLPVS